MTAKIIPIVEGHGEVAAVPILLRRIAEALEVYDARITTPIRIPRSQLMKPAELARAIKLAVLKGGREGRVLLLLDADEGCPKDLGPQLLGQARSARPDIPVGVVLAKREFEAWFLGSLESLAPDFRVVPGKGLQRDPEDISGAKERLGELLGIYYSETIDQPAMTAKFDMDAAKEKCPSFEKCWRTVAELLRE